MENYKVGYYCDEKVKVTKEEASEVVEGILRAKIHHKYYRDNHNNSKVGFGSNNKSHVRGLNYNNNSKVGKLGLDYDSNTKVCGGVMFNVLQAVKKVEERRVQMILKKTGSTFKSTTIETKTMVKSGESIGTANYIIEVGLGTPSRQLTLVIDTGSDLAWTQCQPCSTSCYGQNDPIFDPSTSSTYKSVACNASLCKTIAKKMASGCTSTGNVCEYGIQYADGSFTIGNLAIETITLGTMKLSTFPFGCGFDNEGLFNGFDGLLGLSRDSLAFPMQSRSSTFSYCLPSPFSPSAVGFLEFRSSFGRVASIVPLLSSTSNSFYTVSISSILVDSSSIGTISSKNTLVIDSGTVITRLDSTLYNMVRDAFKEATASLPSASPDVGEGLFDTCFKLNVGSKVSIPTITFNLGENIQFSPPITSLLYPMDNSGTMCFAFAPIKSNSHISILGNYQQQGYTFTFHIASPPFLSIKPDTC